MINLKDVLTCELVEELKKREGVDFLIVPDPEWDYSIELEPNDDDIFEVEGGYGSGPATILVVID